jgi:L,D-peptidoglycan transpeptidase YkuD (ErfK/YbiS/YcfS/YnhG family)
MDIEVGARGMRWQLSFGRRLWRCAVGRGGITNDKNEGDSATPAGCWAMRRLFYRPDRLSAPQSVFGATAITPADGWCDDPGAADYNRLVRLPCASSHERLWREDGLYDLMVTLGYNDDPPIPGLGSAIFLHLAREDYAPTEGCVALALPNLLTLMREVSLETRLCVQGTSASSDGITRRS